MRTNALDTGTDEGAASIDGEDVRTLCQSDNAMRCALIKTGYCLKPTWTLLRDGLLPDIK